MIKYFCDRCGKETKIAITVPIYIHDGRGAVIDQIDSKDICEDCAKKLAEIKDELTKKHYLQDFLLMSDEDVELLRYTFKPGDKVIASDGRTGKIRDICTCDKCKERGFYEANIDYDDETTDWLMISDKKNGFKSYYSIGDRVFGNLDEESVSKELEEIGERYNKLVKQQSVIYYLKTKKESTNEI
jgi:hypothetical protein